MLWEKFKRWMTKKDRQIKCLELSLAEETRYREACQENINILREMNSELCRNLSKNEYIKKKAIVRPTRSTLERMKKGELCSGCHKALKKFT